MSGKNQSRKVKFTNLSGARVFHYANEPHVFSPEGAVATSTVNRKSRPTRTENNDKRRAYNTFSRNVQESELNNARERGEIRGLNEPATKFGARVSREVGTRGYFDLFANVVAPLPETTGVGSGVNRTEANKQARSKAVRNYLERVAREKAGRTEASAAAGSGSAMTVAQFGQQLADFMRSEVEGEQPSAPAAAGSGAKSKAVNLSPAPLPAPAPHPVEVEPPPLPAPTTFSQLGNQFAEFLRSQAENRPVEEAPAQAARPPSNFSRLVQEHQAQHATAASSLRRRGAAPVNVPPGPATNGENKPGLLQEYNRRLDIVLDRMNKLRRELRRLSDESLKWEVHYDPVMLRYYGLRNTRPNRINLQEFQSQYEIEIARARVERELQKLEYIKKELIKKIDEIENPSLYSVICTELGKCFRPRKKKGGTRRKVSRKSRKTRRH
jgi:hypothetical protein